MSELPEHEPVWVDTAISWLLRGGVLLSVTVIVAGLVTSFVHHPEYVSSRTELRHLTDVTRVYPHALRGVLEQASAGRGESIVMGGLLLLIATPVSRVAFSVVLFALERDRIYTAITLAVFTLIIASFVIGAGG